MYFRHVHRRITRFLKHGKQVIWFTRDIFQCADSVHKGYLMDMKVLQQCVRANVGDLTFEASLYLSLGEFS